MSAFGELFQAPQMGLDRVQRPRAEAHLQIRRQRGGSADASPTRRHGRSEALVHPLRTGGVKCSPRNAWFWLPQSEP